jgi:hypothetical protein
LPAERPKSGVSRPNWEQERVAVPTSNLAAVGARELRVDCLASVQTFDLGDGRAAIDLGADGAARRGREGIGQVEELLAGLLGRWMRNGGSTATWPAELLRVIHTRVDEVTGRRAGRGADC